MEFYPGLIDAQDQAALLELFDAALKAVGPGARHDNIAARRQEIMEAAQRGVHALQERAPV